jgi:AcrR family transcriptional regulator
MNRREVRASLRLRDILHVAARLFAELGYERTTLDMVAEELGLTKPALYYYVKSKEDVLTQILDRMMRSTEESVMEAVSQQVSAHDRLRALISAHLTSICVYPEGRALVLYESNLLAKKNEDMAASRSRFQHLLQEIIADGVKEGVFHVSDTRTASLAILGAMNWVPRWYSPTGEYNTDELSDQFVGLLLRGVERADIPQADAVSASPTKRSARTK